MPVHRIPPAKPEHEKQALDRYVEQGVIIKVNEPTAWCSNELIPEITEEVQSVYRPKSKSKEGHTLPQTPDANPKWKAS